MSAKGLKLFVKHYILYGQNGLNVGLGGAKDKETMYSVLQLSSNPMIGIQRSVCKRSNERKYWTDHRQ